jgi:hypothetical protein
VYPHSDRRSSDPRERVITIANETARGLVSWKRFAQLLGGPRRGGMGGDSHVHDAAPVVREVTSTKRSRHVAVGTTKKSAAVI